MEQQLNQSNQSTSAAQSLYSTTPPQVIQTRDKKLKAEEDILGFINDTHRNLKTRSEPVKAPTETASEETVAKETDQVDELADEKKELFSGLLNEPESEDEVVDQEDTETADTNDKGKTLNSVNFLDFAKANPDVEIVIPNKKVEGGFIKMTAKKAAAILGEASQLDHVARSLKVKEADIELKAKDKQDYLDNLVIGLEITLEPRLREAGQDIQEAMKHNKAWEEWAEENKDAASQAQAKEAIEANNKIIQQKSKFIDETRPKADHFYAMRAQYVKDTLDSQRKQFQNKELKNPVIFEEVRTNLKSAWTRADQALYPGIKNIDLVSSDEELLSLIHDGLKYRSGPKSVKQAGQSLSGLSSKSRSVKAPEDPNKELEDRAKKGDKTAQANIIMGFINSNKRR